MAFVTLTIDVAELSGVVNLMSADVTLDTDGRYCFFRPKISNFFLWVSGTLPVYFLYHTIKSLNVMLNRPVIQATICPNNLITPDMNLYIESLICYIHSMFFSSK